MKILFWFTYRKYIYICLTLIWIGVIFSFSLQPSSKSEVLSDGEGQIILEHSSSETLESSEAWTESQWTHFHKVIRKCGHLAEFFVLGILMILMMNAVQVKYEKVFAFLACVLVAVCDETIQLFIPGRVGMLADVILDSIGSLASIMVYFVFYSISFKSFSYNKPAVIQNGR
jgi:VanZ family protein